MLKLPKIIRRSAYRLGRALYKVARGDGPNTITRNGEMLVQRCVVNAWATTGRTDRLVILDVGANIGDWTAALLPMLPKPARDARVDIYMFEPVPATLEGLKRRIGTQTPFLHYEATALSSVTGDAVIHVSGVNAGTNSLYSSSAEGQSQGIAVRTLTATEFVNARNIERIQLLKSDTEGHDMEVIRGAVPLLNAERIDVLQFEYNHRWIFARNFLRDVFTCISGLPYLVAKVQPDHILILDRWHPELEQFFEGNYALVHRASVGWFPSKRARWDRYNTMRIDQQ